MDQTLKLQHPKSVLILGCGDLGQKTAQYLAAKEIVVVGIRRNPPSHNEDAGDYPLFQYKKGDIRDIESIAPYLNDTITDIIFCPTADDSSEESYLATYYQPLQKLCDYIVSQRLMPRILFVSSTSVYAQDTGERVDETSPTQPRRFNGVCLLQCETFLTASGLPHLVLRLGGIYGKNRRRLLDQLLSDKIQTPYQMTNRIHIEDAARAITHLITAPSLEHVIFCITDHQPVTKFEIYHWLKPEASQHTNLHFDSKKITGKAIDNLRLQQTGFKFCYPTFKEGYQAILNNKI